MRLPLPVALCILSSAAFCGLPALVAAEPGAPSISRIWLTHQSPDPGRLVVNWETDAPGDSVVEFGTTPNLGERATQSESVTLHHVEIPLSQKDVAIHYRVRSGGEISGVHTCKGYSSKELRVAVIGDAGYAKRRWSDAVLRADPHLLLTAGDNVPSLHNGASTDRDDITAFRKLIRENERLFQSVPFMPILGNHDREFRPRGPKPPEQPVYDIEASAFRNFFALPGDEWHWTFDVPDFGVRFIALDLSHLQDVGTTWQTSHPFGRDSVQFQWFRDIMNASSQPFVVTLYNEQNAKMRNLEGGEWGRMIMQGSTAITGFGYFAERAEVNDFPFYNTSVSGTGSKYPDSKSVVLKSEDNFLLLTLRRESRELTVELKNLEGAVLDQKVIGPRNVSH